MKIKKRTIFILLALFIFLILGFYIIRTIRISEENRKKVLEVWSFSEDAETLSVAFKEFNPDITVNFTMIPMEDGSYQQKLEETLASGKNVPDVVFLETSFMREFVESDYLMDLNELKRYTTPIETFKYTLDVGTFNGITKAYSYQSAPGALFYRRSLAREYFGTDDPAEIEVLLSDFEKFNDVAEDIHEKSNGSTYIIASIEDLVEPFLSNRKTPWIVDNVLVISPEVDSLFDLARDYRYNGYEAGAKQWELGWYAGISDSLIGPAGEEKQVFSYFLPSWGLQYVLMEHSVSLNGNTNGDWAVVNGPAPYYWGGSWLAVPENAENKDVAKEFVQFCTMNEQTLKNWATGVYTNDYLKAIDSEISNGLAQKPGDVTSSAKVCREILTQFDDDETSKFLGGQNYYEFFTENASKIFANLIQPTDDIIKKELISALEIYSSGEKTKEESIEIFKESVKEELPDVIIN